MKSDMTYFILYPYFHLKNNWFKFHVLEKPIELEIYSLVRLELLNTFGCILKTDLVLMSSTA